MNEIWKRTGVLRWAERCESCTLPDPLGRYGAPGISGQRWITKLEESWIRVDNGEERWVEVPTVTNPED